MLTALEAQGGWCFQAKHVKGVDNKLANEIKRQVAGHSEQANVCVGGWLALDSTTDGARGILLSRGRRVSVCALIRRKTKAHTAVPDIIVYPVPGT